MTLGLSEVKRQSYHGNSAINRAAKIGDFSLTAEQTRGNPLLIVAEVKVEDVLVERTFYWSNFQGAPGCLFRLPRTTLAMTVGKGTATVTNTGQVPAVGHIRRTSRPSRHVLPADDNFFWLDPSESRTLSIDETSGLRAGAWNVETR